jgi:predicted ATPase/DNA-binding CsgD family transcriptional regulator
MAASRPGRADGLPGELTSFVGRRANIAEVRQLLGASRLVTLTGPGGVGKTRLAIRVARTAERAFKDGVHLVELAGLTDPALLPHTVLDAMAVTEHTKRSPMLVLGDYLRHRDALLVLDNCEHILDGVAALTDTLLRSAPDLRVLATSRQSLAIEGEHVYPVPTLPGPDPRVPLPPRLVQTFPGVTLLADRAAAVVPGFQVNAQNQDDVIRLCQRLEGIPLAIELAAVRLRVLTVAELADRLDDRFQILTQGRRRAPERHQTLQATIDYSYSLCSQAEQLLWARASCFTGGFGLDAAESICTDEKLPRATVLDTISALTEKSIFSRDEHDGVLRFGMLETIREYGLTRLQELDEVETLRRRHRNWYQDVVERACAEWFGQRQGAWAQALLRDHANLRSALDYCLSEPGEIERGLLMAGRPWFLWIACGLVTEGHFWLERLLRESTEPTIERAWALMTGAYVATLRGGDETVDAYLQESLEIGRRAGDSGVVAYATHLIANHDFLNGDLKGAIDQFHAGLRLYEACDLPADYVNTMKVQLALAHLLVDEVDEASQILEDVYRDCEQAGESWLLSFATYGRGFVELIRGQFDDAERDLRDALKIKRFFHDTLGLALVLDVLAWTSIAKGNSRFGLVLLGAVSKVWESLGAQLFGFEHMMGHRQHFARLARESLGDRVAAAAWAEGSSMRLEDALDFASGQGTKPLSERPGATGGPTQLTRREREVADLVADGLSNKEIAASLVISLRTAETHVEHILTKLGFNSRAQIAMWLADQRELKARS